jgi:hypothetical protein
MREIRDGVAIAMFRERAEQLERRATQLEVRQYRGAPIEAKAKRDSGALPHGSATSIEPLRRAD